MQIWDSSENSKTYNISVTRRVNNRNALAFFITWYGMLYFRHDDVNHELYPLGTWLEGVTYSTSNFSSFGKNLSFKFNLSSESWGGIRMLWFD